MVESLDRAHIHSFGDYFVVAIDKQTHASRALDLLGATGNMVIISLSTICFVKSKVL